MAKPDPTRALNAALLRLFEHGNAQITSSATRPWVSATFAGARHVMTLSVSGIDAQAQARAFCAKLSEEEFNLPGHFVADIAAELTECGPDHARVHLEALTVEAD